MDTPNVGKKTITDLIAAIPAAQLPTIPAVAARFKALYQVFNGNSKMANEYYEAEKFHFMKTINDSKDLQACTKMSLYGCFLDVGVSGLSFDPSYKHVYLVPFNVNVGTRQSPRWEKRAQLMISGYGELVLRQRQQQIKYVDNPMIVYEGDKFSYGTKEGGGYVEHVATVPRKTEKIIACYLKITRNDGTVDYKVITDEDMKRFMAFAKKDKEGNLGKAWTDGIGGMWQSKVIKHAFKNYPKMRNVGKYTEVETNTIDADVDVLPDVKDIDYDMVETHAAVASEEDHDTTEVKERSKERAEDGSSFMDDDKNEKKSSGTIHINAEEEEEGFR